MPAQRQTDQPSATTVEFAQFLISSHKKSLFVRLILSAALLLCSVKAAVLQTVEFLSPDRKVYEDL